MAQFLNVSITDLTGDNQEHTEKQISEYRLKKAWQLTEFLEPTLNYCDPFGLDTPRLDENGHIVVYSAKKIIYKNGSVIDCGDGYNAVSFTKRDFVKVMEQAEHNALYRQTSLNAAFREIVFGESK